MINFNQLRAFYFTAKHLNFTKAAEKLFITQPAVTAQVQNFEESLNLKLFKKRGRLIYLTAEGKLLYERAHNIFKGEQDFIDAVEEIKQLKEGILRLGAVRIYSRYVMPFFTARFLEANPNIRIQLDEGSTDDLIHNLLNMKNDLVIVGKNEEYPDIKFTRLTCLKIVAIMSHKHHLANNESLTIDDLDGEPLIIKEEGSAIRKLVFRLYSSKGIAPNILIETSNIELIKQLVVKGEGITFLPREEFFLELKSKKVLAKSLNDEKTWLEIFIAYLKNQPISPPTSAFLEMVDKTLGEMPIQGTDLLIERILSS